MLMAKQKKINQSAWRLMQTRSGFEWAVDSAAFALNSPTSKPKAGPRITAGLMAANTPLATTVPLPEAPVAITAAFAPESVIAGKAANTATVRARLGRVRIKVVSTIAASSSRIIERAL